MGTETEIGDDPCDEGFGLYVHWPWCLSKCPYCDFNSHVIGSVDHARWARAYVRELETLAATAPRRPLTSVFFGGGTPSLMEPATIAAVLEAAARLWPLAPDLEVTLEANPGAADRARFDGARAAGINRLSLGVQALDDAALRALGRRHDRAGALAALDHARAVFDRVSVDLIHTRPGQTPDAWAAELGQVLGLGLDHLSLYQLTIEPGTAFFRALRDGALTPPDEDAAADLFALTQEMTTAAGLPAYEVSNHARPGAESRHNLVYWRGGDYVGIGPGAHGRLDGTATQGVAAPTAWLARVEADGDGLAARDPLSTDERATELLMMGLRLTEGVNAARFARLCGRRLVDCLDPHGQAEMADLGLVTWDGRRLRATPAGRDCLNAVIARLVAA
ncbi:radical SAM family heme chaperone HemW [Rhodospira trueperi]|uniref:Heme chaperone HemW n=1 Tax=Rhodospira trueperi TaxID=69960 RepID=A0A1G7ATV6_9PROT|nr:radical SAM family heme chaperone HemW [Rhodospira trueperi]SDE18269.1 oxygen-independent coproporphyrinogen-3 oxidase [Rhodospira trueperi]